MLDKHQYVVEPIKRTEALPLVQAFHYAKGASNTAVFLHGLKRGGHL